MLYVEIYTQPSKPHKVAYFSGLYSTQKYMGRINGLKCIYESRYCRR